MKSVLRFVVSAGLVAGTLLVPLASPSVAATSAAAPITVADLGTSAATAAGSCWEIKKLRPAAANGTYWLLTPKMVAPQQFYCDMTTDGGGWVLVGKGRENWTNTYLGQGNENKLTTAGPSDPANLATTNQASSRTIDALLNGGRVDALAEGVRLKRATNTAGTTYQESRVLFNGKKDRWSWTFNAEQPLKSYSFDGVSTTASSTTTSANYGTDSAFKRVNNLADEAHTFKLGFMYGAGVTGNSAATSYLWTPTTGGTAAIPYTEVYVRPKVTTFDAGFTAIPDAGTAAVSGQRRLVNDALVTPWGVANRTGSTTDEFTVEVQAFTQSGNTMFVGGNFSTVQKDATGTGAVNQPYLAGFDVTTGELVTSFKPVLNEQVTSLATLPDGSVVAGGLFTQANGQAATGIVALNPTTGATNPNFKLKLENRVTGGVLTVRSLDVAGNWLYVGGAVTHFSGGSKPNTAVYMRNLGRVSLTDGTPGTGWNPNFNGSVIKSNGSSDDSRVYAAGYFTTSNGAAAKNAAAVQTAAGAALVTTPWTPTWSSSKSYQQAIEEIGNRVWVGGSEHSLFSFDKNTFQRVSGNIAKDNGDTQALTSKDGLIYMGCHCADWDYENAYTWRTLNSDWLRGDTMKWFGMWDAATGARIPDFTPEFTMARGQGVWALATDNLGNVWAGGDISTVRTSAGNKFSGGFARFGLADTTPPGTPGNVQVASQTSTTVNLTWDAVSDNSTVNYEVLRDDRPIGTTFTRNLTVPKGGSNRFFVRAIDASNNAGASSAVVSVDGINALPKPAFTASVNKSVVSFDGSSSTASSGSITKYGWAFGDGASGTGSATGHPYAVAGDYPVWLTTLTSTGAVATRSAVVTTTAAGAAAPADNFGKTVFNQSPWAYYRLDDTFGSTARDAGPNAYTGTYSGTVTKGQTGAVSGNTAVVPSPTVGGGMASPKLTAAPGAFSEGIWFKTSSTTGGRLIGYSSAASGNSTSYDRMLFLQADGKLVFGVDNGSQQKVVSPASYNDNQWHYAVATQSPTAGMSLYVDGVSVATNAAVTGGANFLGYWRVGTDLVWSGASTPTLSGTLDEASVFTRALTAEEVAAQYSAGSGTVVNTPPTAAFTSSSAGLDASFNGTGSSDAEGPIASYAWDFGDSTTGTGANATHTYAAPGTYNVKLTVTDAGGSTASSTSPITVANVAAERTAIASGSDWRWRYATGAPDAGWNTPTFNASGWQLGSAILGFGATTVKTNIDTFATTAERPVTAYFTKSFEVPAGANVTKLTLSSVADDGAVFYVNGTEVARQNMPTGTITPTTYASSARRSTVANSSPVVVDVPLSALRSGTNVVSVETHVNYRGTPDLTFDLEAKITY